jgi:GNAT superfamily N-acetyltransferase
MHVRAYRPEDFAAVRDCLIALQEYERALDGRLPAGADVADAYFNGLFERCQRCAGQLFVADLDGRVIGFASVLGACDPDDPTDDPAPFAYVDDLVVLSDYRRHGVGRALLLQAEEYSRRCGRSSLRLRVKGANRVAQEFYRLNGYADYERELEKRL